jgi:hypothetical protein
VKAMSKVFRGKFISLLKERLPEEMNTGLVNDLYKKKWVVYAKRPFGGPQSVIEYLGRYIHPVRSSRISVSMPFCFSTSNGASKVAISNHRICSINDEQGTVTFNFKDYADGGKQKQMTLCAAEFIRRFEQHILPERFCKIRTYGYLSNRNRHQRINEVLTKMKLPLHKGLIKIPLQVRMLEQFGIDMDQCPCCKSKTLNLVKIFYPRRSGRHAWKQEQLVCQPADDG